MWFDREVDELVKLAGDDAVLESVLVDVLVDMLEVDVLEDRDVELLDLRCDSCETDAQQIGDRCRRKPHFRQMSAFPLGNYLEQLCCQW